MDMKFLQQSLMKLCYVACKMTDFSCLVFKLTTKNKEGRHYEDVLVNYIDIEDLLVSTLDDCK